MTGFHRLALNPGYTTTIDTKKSLDPSMSRSVTALIALDFKFHWESYVPENLGGSSLTVDTR